jgi:hypothetical protein
MFNDIAFDLDNSKDVVEPELDEMLQLLHGIAVVHKFDLQLEYLKEAEATNTKVVVRRTELSSYLRIAMFHEGRQVGYLRLRLTTETPLVVQHILPQ